jgi:hypothetical protein
MNWAKKGLIFRPPRGIGWAARHAAVACADRLNGDRYRIYFTARDVSNHSQIGFFEIDIRTPEESLYISPQPVLRSGSLGTFDESGAMSSWIHKQNGRLYL